MEKLHGKFPEVEDIVMKFFVQCHASNIPMSVPILMVKAIEIPLKLNVSDASFSIILLFKFKLRQGISS